MALLFSNEQTVIPVDTSFIEAKVETLLKALQHENSELSLTFVSDQEIQQLNSQYREADRPTDVLSFPQWDDAFDEYPLLGDVVVSVEMAQRQALDHHLALDEELILLVIHGILHLLGWDHDNPDDEREMQEKTGELFERIFPGRKPGGTCNFITP